MKKSFQRGDKVYFFDDYGKVEATVVSTSAPFCRVKTKDSEKTIPIALLFVRE